MTLPKGLQDKWDEASRTGQPVDVGDYVVCDYCDKDYTDSDAEGGLIFTGSAVCPACEPKTRNTIRKYKEERFIRATCPKGQSFADFVRAYRRADDSNIVQVSQGLLKTECFTGGDYD